MLPFAADKKHKRFCVRKATPAIFLKKIAPDAHVSCLFLFRVSQFGTKLPSFPEISPLAWNSLSGIQRIWILICLDPTVLKIEAPIISGGRPTGLHLPDARS